MSFALLRPPGGCNPAQVPRERRTSSLASISRSTMHCPPRCRRHSPRQYRLHRSRLRSPRRRPRLHSPRRCRRHSPRRRLRLHNPRQHRLLHRLRHRLANMNRIVPRARGATTAGTTMPGAWSRDRVNARPLSAGGQRPAFLRRMRQPKRSNWRMAKKAWEKGE